MGTVRNPPPPAALKLPTMMKRISLLALLLLGLGPVFARAEEIKIDWQRAHELHARASRGETLSPEDQKYYEEAKRQRSRGGESGGSTARTGDNAEMQRLKDIHRRKEADEAVTPEEEKLLAEAMRKHGAGGDASTDEPGRQRARDLMKRKQAGEKLSPEEEKQLAEVLQRRGGTLRDPNAPKRQAPPPPPEGLVALTDPKASYKGQDGGLYGGGKNEPPKELAERAAKAAVKIQPLDKDGNPSPEGKIVLMSIGMSNTTQEFSAFKRLADADPRKAANVVVVDAAQGGRDALNWERAAMETWQTAEERLTAAGVTPQQVQAVWLKQAIAGPRGGWPAETDRLRDLLSKIVGVAKGKYPNLKLVYLSSRTYAGYASTSLNPEPYAYESAFAVRDLIREQSADEKAPVLLWGHYLWADGEKGRNMDDFKWTKEDVGPDGTHPSEAGRQKVAKLLLEFLAKDPYAAPWFVKG